MDRLRILYELLKSYADRKYPPTLTIDELKEKLDMQEKSYSRFERFYKRGIEEPLKEINENTDIRVLVVKNRDKSDKRKIVSLTFKIKNQAEKKVWWEYDFPKEKLLVFYCDRGGASMAAAREFVRRGYRTRSVIGGFAAYRGRNLVISR